MTGNVRKYLLSAGLVSGFVFASHAQQLLNASFEDPELQQENPWGDIAAHWGRWGNWMNRETVWEPTHTGKCLMGYHHWQVEEDSVSGFFQDVPAIPPNTPCTFTIHAFRDEETNAESIELRMEKLGGFDQIASRVFKLEEIRKNGWGPLSISGATLGEGVRVLVAVKPKPGSDRRGAIKFDDAELRFELPAQK